MSRYDYSRYKIRIEADSRKRQGLRTGDVVRRQYVDGERTIYSLMVVLATGEETLTLSDGRQCLSPYFIGALIEGDEPREGELLDFVRLTNLMDERRSGALYLSASDEEAPYMDVVDGMATQLSLCRPAANKYTFVGDTLFTPSARTDSADASRIVRLVRNGLLDGTTEPVGLRQRFSGVPEHPGRVVCSLRIRASRTMPGVALSFGVAGSDREAEEQLTVTTAWQHRLLLVTIDFPVTTRELIVDMKNCGWQAGDWLEIADLNIVALPTFTTFAAAARARVGKITGIADPIFGRLQGYGAYFQRLYATRDVSVAGTLTAGDEKGFASTFYVGRIHRNSLINSIYCDFTGKVTHLSTTPPTGIGQNVMLPANGGELICQSEEWSRLHAGERYCFSFWLFRLAVDEHSVRILHEGRELAVFTVSRTWERYSCALEVVHTAGKPFCLTIECSNICFFASPQLEAGELPTLYQPTDSTLRETSEFGAWFCRGGVGGTIQNPLLRLESDGSIRAGNDSFVINPDGSGYFSGGAIRWDERAVTLSEHVLLKWENLDAATRENLTGKDAYSVYLGTPGCLFQASSSGVITAEQRLEIRIYAYKGRTQVTPTVGTLPQVKGMELTAGSDSRSIVVLVRAGTSELPDAGTVEIPVFVDGLTFRTAFSWAKAKAGLSASDFEGMDWIAEWNSHRTQIGATTLITPKIFAGVKHADNTVTGVALGDFDLNIRQGDGSIAAAHVGGISAFRDGLRTFYVDDTGNAGLGYGEQSVRYNASTGRIEFGAGVSLVWTSAIAAAKSETLSAAATTAQSKADAALGSAKAYADTKKNEAVTQAGKEADGKLSTLSATLGTSIAEAKKAGTDARAVADAITSKASAEGWSTKLTYIDSSGIFTGTLSANTVDAVRINASQITAGTIAAARLDAAGIRANIINTDYINGLSCNFVRGKIGGWTIGATALTNSHIVLDSGNRRVAVYGANANAVGGHRVQLYYNSDNDFGLWASDAAGTRVASLGSTNQIAGWNIESARIHKNNVSLGADGSISNSTKWKLNNDGSGSLASGSISWDAAGKVTFSSAVSLLWKNDIEAAKSANYGYRYYKRIVINGDDATYYPVIFKGGDQGYKRDIMVRRSFPEQAPDTWHTSTHKGGLSLLIRTNFGGWGGIAYSWDIYDLSEMYCRMFGGAAHCGNYCMFAVFLRGGGDTGAVYHLYSDQPIESSALSPSPIPPAPQIAYDSDLIFQSGETQAKAPAPRTLTAAVEEEIRRHRFIALAQGSDTTLANHPLTYIGSTGIYTGTLTAAQVNAVSIDASSIKTGTLSADRIAAGSINSSKLDAASIKANIINASYINGLTCAFVRGVIGGWTIGASAITAAHISIDSANKRIAVYGASSSAVSGKRVQLYYNSDSDFGLYATDANGSCVAALGSANRIAGWNIDISRIYKNNVSLGADGSITNSSRWKLNNDGSASFGSGKSLFNTDGSGQVANGKFKWDAAGNIVAQGGNFKNVTIEGTIRSAFVQNDPSIWIIVGGGTPSEVQTDPVHYDNVVCTQTGGWNENINLTWELSNSGRRICLVNYKWGSTISTGYMSITAPTGKYFFEDGIGKSTLSFSREVIEMIGYGDDKTFFGWIVLNRRDIMTSGRYGNYQQILASGTLVGSSSGISSFKYRTFDGSSMSSSRLDVGVYRVYLPSAWSLNSRYLVMMTGIYTNTMIYPTLKAQYSYYFDVWTQDDASRNEGAFNFQVFSTCNWDQ